MEKEQLPKSTQQSGGRGILRLFRVALAVFVLCIIGIAINFWTTDSYEGQVYVQPPTDGSQHSEHPSEGPVSTEAYTKWFRINFYAASNERDAGVTSKADNVSAFDSDDHTCTVPRLDDSNHPSYVTCNRPKPINGSCDIANKTFHSEPIPTCSHQKHYDICRIKIATDSPQIDCTNNVCSNTILLGTINRASGSIQWRKNKNLVVLEEAIRNILQNDRNGHFGFCFLQCTLKGKTVASQLLLLPKNFSQISCHEGDSCRDSISVNVIWLDSTSHSHFYRSMPKSVETFRRVKSNQDAHVFSYNLMQSLKGGTYVNTIAFTSGNVSSRGHLLKRRVPIGDLFKMFQRKGHHVTWIDDLCWRWSLDHCACGIPKLLGLAPTKKKSYIVAWNSLQKSLTKKGVDQIDVSLANCEIMKANDISDPFKSKSKTVAICYNGRYQTDYILSALEMLQTQLNLVRRPFFNYLDLNLGHEASGRRIQTLDNSFAKLITFLSRQNNTFTLIFGDHGNKYGTFVKATKESKIEMAHTVLFVMASNDLKDKLGEEKLNALDVNQHRLVNIIDLRHTLLTLVPGISDKTLSVNNTFDTHPNGLFHPIDPRRSCKSMGIPLEAGKCICEEGVVNHGVKNDTKVVVMADFALGQINNKIQEQFMAANSNEDGGYGFCQRLVGRWISEVQETIIIVENTAITEMNIHVPAGTNAPQSEDVFSVVIHVSPHNSNITLLNLVHYERISTYGVYDKCRDISVDGDLCICSLSEETDVNEKKTVQYWHEIPQTVFDHPTTTISLNDCLFIYERRTHYGLVVETSCDCPDNSFRVDIVIVNHMNVAHSQLPPLVASVRPGMMLFVAAFHQLDPMLPWSLDYKVQYRYLP